MKLGVSFRAKLSEPDLEVYAEMIERRLDDREWRYAYDWFTGDWTDPGEAPRFMPTPQELIAIGRFAPRPPKPPTEDEREFRRLYFAAAKHLESQHLPRHKLLPSIGQEMTDAEWEHRRRFLLEQGDELLHPGKAPDASQE